MFPFYPMTRSPLFCRQLMFVPTYTGSLSNLSQPSGVLFLFQDQTEINIHDFQDN